MLRQGHIFALGGEQTGGIDLQQGVAGPDFLTQRVDRQVLNSARNGGRNHPVADVVVIDGAREAKTAHQGGFGDLAGFEVYQLDGVGAQDHGGSFGRHDGFTLVHWGELHAADRAATRLVRSDPRVHRRLVKSDGPLADWTRCLLRRCRGVRMSAEANECSTGEDARHKGGQHQESGSVHGAGEEIEGAGREDCGRSVHPQVRRSSAMADHCSATAWA